MTQFEDGLGNPISVGDRAIYAVCSGSSSAEFQRCEIERVSPVLLDASGKPERYEGQKARYGDYALNYPKKKHRTGPNQYDYTFADAPEWMYRVRVKRLNEAWEPEGDKLTTIHNIDRLVVVTSIA